MTGQALREWRVSKGWTQRQLARALRIRRKATVSEWEAKADLPDRVVRKIERLQRRG